MRLARGTVGQQPGPRALVVHDDRAVPLDAPDSDDPLLDVLRAGARADVRAAARRLAGGGGKDSRAGDVVDLADVRLLAPLARPGKIVAVGLNYLDHSAEAGFETPKEPLTFAKYPSAVVGPGDEIVVPTALTRQADWEAELAVVVGVRCGPARRGTLADVAGYTIANDVSARDLQFADQQWTRAKSLDTFCPLGPVIVTPEEFGDPGGHRISTTVNGATMQDASTSDLVFDVPALLHALTAGMTLEPGDVVLTGTPPGVGAFRTPPVFLEDGDVVVVSVEGIGELRNPVRHR